MNLAFLPLLEERISLQEGGSGALPMSDHGAPDCIVQAFVGTQEEGTEVRQENREKFKRKQLPKKFTNSTVGFLSGPSPAPMHLWAGRF